jgi:mannose-6-phosphate isomerase-like protein (cupin superfamily)
MDDTNREEIPMITPGQTLENPVTGERFTSTDTAATSNGDLLGFDFSLRVGGADPIPHVHPIQTERFEVQEGVIRFRIGLRTRLAGPGDVVDVAPGVMHSFANAADNEARLLLSPLVFSAQRRRTRLTARNAWSAA